MSDYWLKPIFIVLAVFAFIVLLMNLGSMWNVAWSSVRDIMIELLPWFSALGIGVFVLVYVMGRK